MNAEKLHAMAIAIHRDLDRTKALTLFKELLDSLQTVIDQPGNSSAQQQFNGVRSELTDVLLESEINDFSPAWRQMISELGGFDILGYALSMRIDEILSENQITPQVAHDNLRDLYEIFENFTIAIEEILASFSKLHVESEELVPGQCEISILIPRGFVSNKLEQFGAELAKLNKIFGVFSELTLGERPGFGIRAISSSDLSIYLDAAPKVCAAIAFSIERIVALYRSLLEIRKLRSELKVLGLNEANLKGVEEHAETVMENGIGKLVDDLENRFLNEPDDGRRNELKIELKYSLKKIAKRIDRGFNIDVRMAAPEASEADGVNAEDRQSHENFETIKRASPNMQFIKSQGEPILYLAEAEGDEAAGQ